MDEFRNDQPRYTGLTGWERPGTPAPFVGQPVPPPPTSRVTTPLPALPSYSTPTTPSPVYTPATLQPVAPRRARGGASGLLLVGMLILGLLAGGLGGGGAALLISQGQHNAPAATVPITAPVVTKPSSNTNGVADTTGSPIHDLYTKVASSIVQVQVELGSGGRFADGGEGSGIVIDSGHVLTNYHVVDGAQAIHILLQDGTSVTGKLVGSAQQDDLAVLSASLPADKVQPAVFADSDSVQVGDEVVAVGNPFGLDHTITAGIVSAVNRSWSDGNGPVQRMIQTDAPINPGNSGGGLFNMQGQVIGITTAIESPVRGSVGVGFAIPSNRAKSLIPQLSQGTSVKRPWLGISGTPMDTELASQLNVPVTKGVLTVQVIAGGPAEKAGIQGADPTQNTGKVGDIITAIDGKPVGSVEDITAYIQTKQVGDSVTVTLWRDGKSQDVKVTLEAWPDQVPQSQTDPNAPSQPGIPGFPNMPGNPNTPSNPSNPNGGRPNQAARVYLGIQGLALDASIAAQINVSINQGVLVTAVTADGPAAKAGIQGADPSTGKAGDIITKVDGTAVSSVPELSRALSAHKAGDTATLTIWRAGQTQDIKVTLADWPSNTTP